MTIQEKELMDLGYLKRPLPGTIPNAPFPGAQDFKPNYLYTKDTIIFHDNRLYRAKAAFKSGEEFNINSWELIAINSASWGEVEGILSEQEDLQNKFNQTDDSISAVNDNLQNEINSTNSELSDLQRDFNAWIGRGGYLTAFDFGVAIPAQESITAQALAEITSITDPLQIWNGTKIVNLFNNWLWILTNTQDTEPPIFEWTNQGVNEISVFSENMGGIIYGADTVSDPPEYVQALPNGKGKVDFDRITNNLLNKIYPIGSTYIQHINDFEPAERDLPGNWKNWTKKAVMYGLTELNITSIIYTPGQTYSTNSFIHWKVPNTGRVMLIKARGNIVAAEVLDPKIWAFSNDSDYDINMYYIQRRKVQPFTDANWATDLNIGDIVIGTQAMKDDNPSINIGYPYYVNEIYTFAGTFPSFEGGNRPDFISGGVAIDQIRNITGVAGGVVAVGASGAFYYAGYFNGIDTGGMTDGIVTFNADRVVPTGPENSPITLSIRYWCREE